jgi:aminoglycoside phosphotransferase (APT) family kinase protein
MLDVPPRLITWAEGVLGARVESVRGLRAGGQPWLLETSTQSGAVLRIADDDRVVDALRVEQAGLELAATSRVPVPRVLAANLDGDPPVLLIELISGSSAIPPECATARLRALGAAAAALHAVTVPAAASLPRRDRPVDGVDFDQLRASAPEQGLLVRAEQARDAFAPNSVDGLVHGDLWQGNAMFAGDTLTGLIDWESAGVGPAGVDLASMRLDAAMCFDVAAADDVLAGWETEAGRCADDVAYWGCRAVRSAVLSLDGRETGTWGATSAPKARARARNQHC